MNRQELLHEFLNDKNSRTTSDGSYIYYVSGNTNIATQNLQTNSIYMSDYGYNNAITSRHLNLLLRYFHATDWDGYDIYYIPSIGFYSERADKKIINTSQIMIDFYTGKLLAK